MQVNRKIILLCFLIVLIFIFGCSSEGKSCIPEDVNKELWEDSFGCIITLEAKLKAESFKYITEEDRDEIFQILDKYKYQDLSLREINIINTVKSMTNCTVLITEAFYLDDEVKSKEYKEKYLKQREVLDEFMNLNGKLKSRESPFQGDFLF